MNRILSARKNDGKFLYNPFKILYYLINNKMYSVIKYYTFLFLTALGVSPKCFKKREEKYWGEL